MAGSDDSLKVLIPTLRSVAHQAFRGAGYEAEDVLAEVADVDFLVFEAGPFFPLRERLIRFAAWRDPTGVALSLNPGLRTHSIATEYDLFVFYCQHKHIPEVHYLNAARKWKERCRKSVCILDELWTHEVYRLRRHLRRLRSFDLVVVGFEGSVRAASEVLEKTCHFVAPAVDTLKFSCRLRRPARCIDVYSLGRRQERLHRALCRIAEDRGLFYMFDTSLGGDTLVANHREHRTVLANIAKRSRCFMVAPALVDRVDHTKGQVEVPNRYFEGAAAGAILLGQRPSCASFERLFDWPDAVVEVRPDGSDCDRVLWDLLHDAQRCERISTGNSQQALLKHDWVYRWKNVFELLDIPPTAAMLRREQTLHTLAASPAPGPNLWLPARKVSY